MDEISAGLDTVTRLLEEISGVGVDPAGGYRRAGFTREERELTEWFGAQATQSGLDVEKDRNGIIWAWLDAPHGRREDAVVTGSHLDSVPGGGAFDGPLGVASALIAVDRIRQSGVQLDRPIAIAVFPEEEGSRFGVACLGSRLLTGAIGVDHALRLVNDDGDTLAEVAARFGLDPAHMGPDPQTLARIGQFVELHVEQGFALGAGPQPIAIASSILGHGRWRITFSGEGNHAGTTLMAIRHDPLVSAAAFIGDVQRVARAIRDARATVGRIVPTPGGTNVIASRVDVYLDVRHPHDAVTRSIVDSLHDHALSRAQEEGCTMVMTEESYGSTVDFDIDLRRRLSAALPDAPVLATGAGHDAGVLARFVPSGMVFVRNPSGISHSPEEYVEPWDAEAGAAALKNVLESLAGNAA